MTTMQRLYLILALFLFVFGEGRRLGMKRLWVYVVCNLLVGISLGLPRFLFLKERRYKSTKIKLLSL